MPKVDERSPDVRVGEVERRVLGALFSAQPDVVAAYLFGSQARGTSGPLSDVDLAVWLGPGAQPADIAARQLQLIGAVADALRTGEVQLVILNHAPPLVAHRVLRDGMLLVDRDPALRVLLESRATIHYLDTISLRETLSRGLARRMETGTFGRPSDG